MLLLFSRALTVPVIDGIQWDDFSINPVYARNSHSRGLFEWGMLYKVGKALLLADNFVSWIRTLDFIVKEKFFVCLFTEIISQNLDF